MPDAGAATPTTVTAPAGQTGRTRRGRGRAGAAPAPLGSLTQREHRAVIACRGCGSTRVTRLSLNLTDGTPVEFTSCHRCEHRTWTRTGGDVLAVDSVLEHARKR
jgi:hypothetical protein